MGLSEHKFMPLHLYHLAFFLHPEKDVLTDTAGFKAEDLRNDKVLRRLL